ncbi:MAG: Fe-S cluster assembly protein SufD [Gemmataceae bacterium]|nr:Fe-S cluster assembly protein SufD [Gemmataceae bacterium]MDW8263952.1 Fe-S cluster assembly protein SufD [Gemmataceae bacterium]
MTGVIDIKETYFSRFSELERALGEREGSPLHRLRQLAIERFAELGFPTTDDEEWRFTNVAPLAQVSFRLPAANEPPAVELKQLLPSWLQAAAGPRLVFVNGRMIPTWSNTDGLPPGVVVTSLGQRLATGAVPAPLGRYADFDVHPFVALNTAFFREGAVVALPKGCVLTDPIHLVWISAAAGEPIMTHPRHLILAGVQTQARIVESYFGPEGAVYFTNAVTEVVLEESAIVEHTKVQQESTEAFHLAAVQVHQDRDSRFTSHAIALGGGLVRNDINVILDAPGTEATLNGLYVGTGRQLIDNHTRIDHARPHGASHELYKGILDGQARGVFNGKIYVHPGAQKTDAKQTNKTLLLSDEAQINSKPQLEIYADDVKCTHGATIGQVAEDMLFYLRTRGIGQDEARRLLTFAFANEVLERLSVEPLRAWLEARFLQSPTAGRETHR